jgi:hypothetical protein
MARVEADDFPRRLASQEMPRAPSSAAHERRLFGCSDAASSRPALRARSLKSHEGKVPVDQSVRGQVADFDVDDVIAGGPSLEKRSSREIVCRGIGVATGIRISSLKTSPPES